MLFRWLPIITLIFSFSLVADEFLKNLSLEETETLAFKNNKDLALSRQAYEQGRQNYYLQVSSYLPQINYSANTSRQEAPVAGNNNFFTSMFSGQQELFSPQVYYSIRIQGRTLDQIYADMQSTTNRLLFDVRSAYYLVVLSHEQVKVQEENVKLLRDSLRIEQNKLKVGESTTYEVEQAKTRVADSLFQYYASVEKMQNSRAALLNIIGLDPDCIDELTLNEKEIPVRKPEILDAKLIQLGLIFKDADEQEISFLEGGEDPKYKILFTPEEVAAWQNEALTESPLLQSLQFQVDAVKQTIAQARSRYLPDVSAFTSWGNAENPGGGFANLPHHWQYGLSLSWSLFDGLNREFSLSKALSQKRSAEISLLKGVYQMKVDIRDTFYEIEKNLMSYFAVYEGVKHSELAVAQAKHRLEAGVITPLEYRETVSAHTVTKQSLNQASYNLLKAYYSLRYLAAKDLGDYEIYRT